jgi:hypothetical protein
MLFLSKYAGGCIFVAFNIAFLLVGLYFYAGLQLGIWNTGILWCIPLFIFSFMIFYSVSALVGLIWKNPIICVVVTCLFWGACFTVGFVRGISEGFLRGPPTIQRLLVVGDTPIAASQQGRILFWNEPSRQWQTAYGEVNGQRVIGPIWNADDKTLYFGRPPFLPFGMTTGDSIRLELAKLPELGAPEGAAADKKLWEDTRLDSGPDLPADTSDLLPWKRSFLTVSPDGLYVYDVEAAAKAEQSKIPIFGFDLKLPQRSGPYSRITPQEWSYRKPLEVAVSSKGDFVMLYSRGKLAKFLEANGKLTLETEIEVDVPAETVINLAMNESVAVICPSGAVPIAVDIQKMSVVGTVDAIGKTSIKRVATASDGRMALLSTDGDVWILDANATNASKPSLTGQGEASTVCFDSKNQLWVAHDVKQVDVWNDGATQSIRSLRPKLTTPEFIYEYIINPFYLVNPKPSAVNETIQYVLRNPDNKVSAFDRNDLEIPQVIRDPWQPIWSNSIFIAVMLGLGCWYLYRQDL